MNAFNAHPSNPSDPATSIPANALPPAPTIELTLSPSEKPLEVDLERFFEFSFDLAEDLLDLEAQFKPRRRVSTDRSRETPTTHR